MKNSMAQVAKMALMILVIVLVSAIAAEAQCPMCRMSAETNLQNGGTAGAGLNKGIIYLLSFPYILVSIVGYLWWRNRRLVQEQDQEAEIRNLLEPHDVVISQSTTFNETIQS